MLWIEKPWLIAAPRSIKLSFAMGRDLGPDYVLIIIQAINRA
jgi:hypothetical protein